MVVAVYDRVVHELAAVAFVDDDRRRARVLYVEALGNEALNRRRIDTGHAVVEFVQGYGDKRGHRAPTGEHGRAVAAAILVGGFGELLVAWARRARAQHA